MNNIEELLKKFNLPETVFKPTGLLFDIDFSVIRKKVCPLCLCKLYPMRNKPFYYCKSKKHRKPFIVNKAKVE